MGNELDSGDWLEGPRQNVENFTDRLTGRDEREREERRAQSRQQAQIEAREQRDAQMSQTEEERRAAARRAAGGRGTRGRASTVLAGSNGSDSANIGTRTLLGG